MGGWIVVVGGRGIKHRVSHHNSTHKVVVVIDIGEQPLPLGAGRRVELAHTLVVVLLERRGAVLCDPVPASK